MIPRRRLPLCQADLAEVERCLLVSAARAATEVAAFEAEFATRMAVPHAIAVASGRDALCLIIDALGLRAGDEIIVPAYTLGELLPLLQERGLVVVAADIDPASFNVTLDSVRDRLRPATRAILVLHQLGAPCAVADIAELAARRGVFLIEDCAHAPGALVAGRPVGGIGDAALFSLESSKALAAFGGGVVATRDAALAARVRAVVAPRTRREWPAARKWLLKVIEELAVRSPAYAVAARLLFDPRRAGAFESFYRRAHQRIRAPGAFTGLQARWARRRLRQLDERNARLAPLWERFAAGLPKGFMAQDRSRHGTPVFYNFVARYAGDLAALRQAALARGLDLGIGGEVMDDCARLLGAVDCPGAAQAFREAVLIPCWDGMGETTIDRVLQRLHAAVEAAA